MIGTIVAALTSRAAGPAGAAAAIAIALIAVGQCSSKNTEAKRADRAESSLQVARTSLATCRSNTRGLEASLAGQSAAVEAWKADGEARGREVEKARQQTRAEAERADRAAATLAKLKPAGVDLCARMLAVDQAVKEATR